MFWFGGYRKVFQWPPWFSVMYCRHDTANSEKRWKGRIDWQLLCVRLFLVKPREFPIILKLHLFIRESLCIFKLIIVGCCTAHSDISCMRKPQNFVIKCATLVYGTNWIGACWWAILVEISKCCFCANIKRDNVHKQFFCGKYVERQRTEERA